MNLTNDLMVIAEKLVEASEGKVTLKDGFFMLNGNQMVCDYSIPKMGVMLIDGKIGGGLPYFFLAIKEGLRFDCPDACKIALLDLQELGNKVIGEKYLDNWNLLFK